ncbi:MAG: 23S rRNA (uracil(1939)-C(5))-methyltransferase RlmD [Acidobacteriaceae bacterium]|jgi:23S rRNA (uracil1939-C5)-methyltransferase
MTAPLNPDIDNINPDDRATPPCPHFGPCGGCQLQHLTYAAQLKLKANELHTLLSPVELDLPEIQLHPSPPLAYRNRIRLTLAQVDGELRAGYISLQTGIARQDDGPASPYASFLPITQCPIAGPILWRATEAFLALLPEHHTALRLTQHIPDQLELFTTADESRLQLTLYLRTAAKSLSKQVSVAFTTFCEALRVRVPELTGAGIALLPPPSIERGRRAETIHPGPSWGVQGLIYSIPGANNNASPIDYWVPRGAFFQANRYLIPELLGLVTANRAGMLAWDLYAGVGLFSRALARSFARVSGVEAAEPAAAALASTGLKNLNAIQATTLDFLRAAVLERDRPGLIILDPPRSGAGPEVSALLAQIAAPTLIYVSCSPRVLPADLGILTARGYRIAELHLVDLFPQTTHIETVAILTR